MKFLFFFFALIAAVMAVPSLSGALNGPPATGNLGEPVNYFQDGGDGCRTCTGGKGGK
jgi:hypothetical protein